MFSAGKIESPSRWLYAKARTIAAQASQQNLAIKKPAIVKREPLEASTGDDGAEYAEEVEGNVPELKGVTLDASALIKLEELEEEERSALFMEYASEAAHKPIRNPSSWVYGRARTKITERFTGRRKGNRSSPY